MVLRTETVDYRCLLRCQGELHDSEGVMDIHSDHFDFAYGTADIMCPVPSGCETPSHITVVSAGNTSEGTEHFHRRCQSCAPPLWNVSKSTALNPQWWFYLGVFQTRILYIIKEKNKNPTFDFVSGYFFMPFRYRQIFGGEESGDEWLLSVWLHRLPLRHVWFHQRAAGNTPFFPYTIRTFSTQWTTSLCKYSSDM